MIFLKASRLPPPNVSSKLLLPSLRHPKDLDHANKDVEEVELKADALVDDIATDHTSFGHTSVVQDLLHVVKSKASKDRKPSVQPDGFAPHKGAGGGGREHEWGETGDCNHGNTSQKRAAKVQVFFLFGCCSHKRDRTHHANRVETGSGEQGR